MSETPNSLNRRVIDLRSDTVTRPTPGMREAIARAEVGDDVFGDDPTVRALEEKVAAITGKEAALFVPSGTMGNQLAIAIHTRPGDQAVVGEGAHPLHYEAGAAGALSGVQLCAVGRGGFFTPDDLEAAIGPRAYYVARTTLAAVENTHNRSGGRIWPLEQARAVADRARSLGLGTHLDGARVWNASAATGVDAATLCASFDTISVCFSKGLGAPVGSAFCASRARVEEARRLRKRWGGAMRQAGILAAAAIYALDHHRARLHEDHVNARELAGRLARIPGCHVDLDAVETNIVNIDLGVPADEVASEARSRGVAINASGPKRLRAVTHLDVSHDDINAAAEILALSIERASQRCASP
jgi:threonine aldolase